MGLGALLNSLLTCVSSLGLVWQHLLTAWPGTSCHRKTLICTHSQNYCSVLLLAINGSKQTLGNSNICCLHSDHRLHCNCIQLLRIQLLITRPIKGKPRFIILLARCLFVLIGRECHSGEWLHLPSFAPYSFPSNPRNAWASCKQGAFVFSPSHCHIMLVKYICPIGPGPSINHTQA